VPPPETADALRRRKTERLSKFDSMRCAALRGGVVVFCFISFHFVPFRPPPRDDRHRRIDPSLLIGIPP